MLETRVESFMSPFDTRSCSNGFECPITEFIGHHNPTEKSPNHRCRFATLAPDTWLTCATLYRGGRGNKTAAIRAFGMAALA